MTKNRCITVIALLVMIGPLFVPRPDLSPSIYDDSGVIVNRSVVPDAAGLAATAHSKLGFVPLVTQRTAFASWANVPRREPLHALFRVHLC